MRDLRTKAAALVVAATLAVVGSACVDDDDAGESELTIINESSFVLVDVRIAEVGERTWGPNLLRGDVLFPGDALTIFDIECGFYDVLVTDETGVDCVLSDIDLCFADDVWVIDDFTLDACAFGL